MMTTNLTKRINESICAVWIPVLRRHRAQVTKRPWKRALSSASLCASLTIEAALSLTLFMFTVILLSVPMEILDTQRKVQTVLEVTGRELGWQVYRTSHTVHPAEMEAGKAAEAEEKGTGGWSELPSGLILQGYLKEKIQTAGGNKVSNIQCGASRVSEDGEWIDLRASYQVRLPFSVFALDHVTLTSRSRKRGWIGAEGGYFSEKNASEPEEKWVYVGRDSTRYHLSPSCHYISNQITAAAYADVISGVLRNSGRCRYKACRYCGKTVSAGGLVYILPSGEVYHGKQDCSSLAYYVQKVRRSEVEYMGVCSYCGSG